MRPSLARNVAAADTLRVLFIGNSFTYFNDMPRIVEGLASGQARRAIQTAMVASGGASLGDNWADTAVQTALHGGRWDWVVVKDQSTFADTYLANGQPRIHKWTELEEYAPRFDSAARAIGARFGIIAHWTDRGAPKRDADALEYAFTTIARRLHATLIPVGTVWRVVRRSNPGIELYDTDNHHPSPAGSYLIASVVYATLTNTRPGPEPDTVRGPAVERDEGRVFPDSVVVLCALPATDAIAAKHRAQSAGRCYTCLGAHCLWYGEGD